MTNVITPKNSSTIAPTGTAAQHSDVFDSPSDSNYFSNDDASFSSTSTSFLESCYTSEESDANEEYSVISCHENKTNSSSGNRLINLPSLTAALNSIACCEKCMQHSKADDLEQFFKFAMTENVALKSKRSMIRSGR